ncbi:contactin-like [Physella acuta]|uniref:contactin-like n=1 Tax=Physella acuta TaxID=109671 RepID=UPI0027DE15AD|nr:contactin-like [Physella acuta]
MIQELVVLLVMVLALEGQLYEGCPSAWFEYSGRCYNFVFTPLRTYQEATIYCQQDFSTLVSINSPGEHSFIQTWLITHDAHRNDWLTSGYRDAADRILWDSDGSLVTENFFPDPAARDRQDVDEKLSIVYNIIVYRYMASSNSYVWAWSRLMKSANFICEINKEDSWKLYQHARDFSYGSNITDPNLWEMAPNITYQSPDTVFYDSNSQRTTVVLECLATGNPRPVYKWYRKSSVQAKEEQVTAELSSRYSVTNGRLTILNPDPSVDVSRYTCEASNKLGVVVSNPVEVIHGYVGEFPNVPSSVIDATTYLGKEITCQHPPTNTDLRYNWYKSNFNFIRPELNAQYFLSKNGNFYISEVQAADVDTYFCMVTMAPKQRQVLTGTQPPSRISMGLKLRVHGENAQTYGPDIQNRFPQVFPEVPMAGETVEIECLAYGRMPLYYSWVRDDDDLNPGAYYKDFNRVLVIPNARVEDTGSYTCVVKGDQNSANKTVYLSLKAIPSFPYPLQNQHLDVGTNFTWTCNAIGIPKPVYTWYKNGVLLTGSTETGVRVYRNTISIDKVDASKHDGVYQCEASNSFGLARSSAQLRVLSFPPTFMHNPVESSKQASLDGNVTISCRPQAAPRARITWLKNGAEVGKVSPNGDLELSGLSRADSGTYTCVASNDLGEARSSCLLTVLEKIVIVDVPHNTEISQNETAVLHCKASFDEKKMDVMYSWKFYSHWLDFTEGSVGKVHYSTAQNSGMLYIIAAQFEHEGEYTCVASTVAGSVSASAFLTVRGPPGEPGGVHVRQAKNGSDLNFGDIAIWWQEGEYHGFPVTKYLIEYLSYFEKDWKLLLAGTWLWTGCSKYLIDYLSYFEKDWKLLLADIPAQDTHIQEYPDWRGVDVREGLSPGTSYQFRVRAGNNQVGYGPASNGPFDWYRMVSAAPLYAPTNIRGGGGSVGLLIIKWDPLPRSLWGSNSVKYIVYFRSRDDRDKDGKWQSTGEIIAHTIEQLVGSENYYLPYEVKVQAVNDMGKGPNSSIEIVYSAEEMPNNVAPLFISAYIINGTATSVTWKPVPNTRESAKGSVFAYQINYWEEPTTLCTGINEHQAMFSRFYGDVDTGVIIGLMPDLRYCINLQFLNHAGIGPKTDIYTFVMNRAPPNNYPEYITVMSHGNESVRMYWRGVSGNAGEEAIRGYKVWWWDLREDIRAARNASFGNTYTGVLHGIERDTVYKARVLAYSMGGDGKKSPDVFFTLGGQVQYDPATTELMNSCTTTSARLLLLVGLLLVTLHAVQPW